MIADAICARKSTVKRVALSRGRGRTSSTFRHWSRSGRPVLVGAGKVRDHHERLWARAAEHGAGGRGPAGDNAALTVPTPVRTCPPGTPGGLAPSTSEV